MSALLDKFITPKATAEEIEAARPLRTTVRQTVLDQYNLLEKELPVYYDAGLTFWQMKPIKTFLESELAWWNANIELTTLQINTRKTSYVEKLADHQKTLQNNLITALKKIPEKSQEIMNKLGNVQGFENPSPSPSPISTVDLSAIAPALEKPPVVSTPPSTLMDGMKDGLSYGLKFVYLIFAVRFAAFAANDLLYKPIQYRLIAFIYSLIFYPIMFPYYVYREVVAIIWPEIGRPHMESIFPVKPYEMGEPITMAHKLYKYPNSPALNDWVKKMQTQENEARAKTLEGTAAFFKGIVESRAT